MFHQASTCTRFLAGSIALAGLSLILITNAPAQQAAQRGPARCRSQPPCPCRATPYSERLMIYYEMVPYGQGYAARLTQNPFPGSPLRQAQIQLEAGDTITAIDDVPIRSAQQLEQHHSQTKVTFLNVRTNRLEARYVMLPPFAGPGPGPAPIPGPGPIPGPSLGILGAPVVIQLQGGGRASPRRLYRALFLLLLLPSAWPCRACESPRSRPVARPSSRGCVLAIPF